MSDDRYRPRTYTTEPAAFGKAATIAWPSVPRSGEARLLAAQVQHHCAVAITREAKAQYVTLKKYARRAGVDYQRLTKILRGEAVMRLEDMANARLHLGDAIPFGHPFVDHPRYRR